MLNLAAIVGPTAAGKSEIAVQVARRIGGEIISCDSMQVYRGMDIGTAKASLDMRSQVAHHLLDVADPAGEFSVADYQKLGQEAIENINARGHIPILVGGTGLYYQALVDDYDFVPLPNLQQVRASLEERCSSNGLPFMYKWLERIDPEYASRIGSNDRKRIIRALEIWEITGQTFSSTQTRRPGKYRLAAAGLMVPRDLLYSRINRRVEQMLASGLVDEVTHLQQLGLNASHRSMQALGYKQVLAYLDGIHKQESADYLNMVEEIQKETRHYAKRQYTWFKKDDRIKWFEIDENIGSRIIIDKISDYMESIIISR